jgi:hypothetical protein
MTQRLLVVEDDPAVRRSLARLVKDRRTREAGRRARESEAEAYRLDALVGRHPLMIEVYKRVGQLAASRVNARIRGETGSGKGMVARAIHYNSPDASHPFTGEQRSSRSAQKSAAYPLNKNERARPEFLLAIMSGYLLPLPPCRPRTVRDPSFLRSDVGRYKETLHAPFRGYPPGGSSCTSRLAMARPVFR